ncbi:very short patch repair endonuclease [Rhodococcus ruber]|uniref:very short patch repair endonuclease n=1 Tax=Rhodococcus ruber TaxID=1830 RepID=UPI0009E72D0D|nr:very short patch repair endonuclease [Rhodococcus ruber]
MKPSWASSAATRRSMRSNRRRDTRPELAVRRLVHAAGLRYRVDFAPLPHRRRNRADMAFTRAKVAVFLDGCYWHGCPDHYYAPKTNVEYWSTKITSNRDRDALVTSAFEESGWTVLRFWEHEDPVVVARTIVETVTGKSARARRTDRNSK